MTAHHEDDQAENALMSLQDQCFGLFLRTMPRRSVPPECSGIYGADFSGQDKSRTTRGGLRLGYEVRNLSTSSPAAWTHVIEYGRFQLVRPFLQMPKSNLIRLCSSVNIRWEEDKTNADVTVTTRNAVRKLLEEERVPAALRKSSLMLSASRVRKEYGLICEIFHFAEHCCRIELFDVRSGMLRVRFVSKFFELMRSSLDERVMKYVAARALQSFLDAVSPDSNIKLQSLKHATFSCFRDLPGALHVTDHLEQDLQSLTAAGVMLHRQMRPDYKLIDDHTEQLSLDSRHIWTFYRQPKRNIPTLEFPTKPYLLPPNRYPADRLVRREWKLWDNRYWINIWNGTPNKMIIRPLNEADISTIRSSLNEVQFRDLVAHLKMVAPGKVRFTLPLMTRLLSAENGREELIALPSLGKKGLLCIGQEGPIPDLDWQIRYKHVSLRSYRALNKLDRFPGKGASIKYDKAVFRSWLDDDFLKGTPQSMIDSLERRSKATLPLTDRTKHRRCSLKLRKLKRRLESRLRSALNIKNTRVKIRSYHRPKSRTVFRSIALDTSDTAKDSTTNRKAAGEIALHRVQRSSGVINSLQTNHRSTFGIKKIKQDPFAPGFYSLNLPKLSPAATHKHLKSRPPDNDAGSQSIEFFTGGATSLEGSSVPNSESYGDGAFHDSSPPFRKKRSHRNQQPIALDQVRLRKVQSGISIKKP